MIKKILPVALISAIIAGGTGCKNGGDFKHVSGISYKIVSHTEGKKKVNYGDIVEFHLMAKVDTTVLGDSRKQQDGKPVPIRVDSVKGSGQWQAVLPYLSEGDSAIVEIMCDTLIKNIPPTQQQLPPWLKKGKKIVINLKVVDIKSMADFQKDMQAKQEAMQKEMQEKAAQQAPIDDKIIQDYLAKNNIKAQKTASGIYYVIHKEGKGANATKGQSVTIDYTGKTLDGKMFDSNTDPSKGHVKPFSFTVGTGQVIPGWDEAATLLKKGSVATVYIPSPLGYGPRGAGADIGPNSVLMFDMEVKDIKAGGSESAPNQQ